MNHSALNNAYLTVAEVGQYLNLSLSKAYTLVHHKDFPICRFGGSIRIPRQAFLTWVDQHTKVPAYLTVM